MSYLEKIQQCNNRRADAFEPLWVEDRRVGWIRNDYVSSLRPFADVFEFTERGIALHHSLDSQQARTDAVQGAIDVLINNGVIDKHYGEIYPVTAAQ